MTLLIILGIYVLGVIITRGVVLADFHNDTLGFMGRYGYEEDKIWLDKRDAEDKVFINKFQFASFLGLGIHIAATDGHRFSGFKLT